MAESRGRRSLRAPERRDLYSDDERYDLVMGAYATSEFVSFYRRQVARYGEPVLELGCGSGRLLIPIAEDGTEIIGFDLSPTMLELAEKKASARGIRISVQRGDMRAFDLGKNFKLVLLPANTMSHLYMLEDIEGCLSSVRKNKPQHKTK
jgi:2-polyprenyl-3-methyl-5-hydroxy-6-metoxy-1,4-benzoquinol methylase